MRLLECGDGKFGAPKDVARDIPRYAILSHTWGPDTEEVTFKDLVDGTGENKTGYEKIRFCAQQAKRDGLQYFWVDTCCIDKSNNTELSAAINSMFRWYQNAARCYVYLSDISTSNNDELAWEPAFRASRWFTRGWTLQELLAPDSVEFFSADGQRLGDKRSLEKQICEIAGVAVLALQGGPLTEFDIKERFKWAETRQTTHEEDWAYCLLGIFGVFMPLIYGEGKANAVRRLKLEITGAMNRNNPPNYQGAKTRAWMVPFEQNPNFAGREADLAKLRQALFTAEQRTAKVAITGLGGVGKTQLALTLVYQIRDEREDCSVIWIPATSKESIGQAYANAAKQLGVPGWEDEKADVKRLVQDHLSSESAGQWLLVFDNADDVTMWVEKSAGESSRLIDYLPKSPRGAIVFTTRDKKAAVRLAGRSIIELSEMDEAGSTELLRNYLVDQELLNNNRDDTTALLAWLAYLPLAIVQAAAYINKNGIGLRDYLSLLDAQEEDIIDLLSEDFEDEGRYHALKNPVATTWLVSFEQVRRDSLAADYLSFMACVDAKDIPQSLLPPGPSRKKETDAMGTLQGYSFIAQRSADSAITIHRLVHLATRNWLRKEGLLPDWTGRVIARLAEVLSDVGPENRVVWRTYMPHAYYTLGSGLGSDDDKDKLQLLFGYGVCLYFNGRYNETEIIFTRVLKVYKTRLGADNPCTLTSMYNLASTFYHQGRWEEAEKLNVQVIEKSKTILGADHPDTLISMNNLALTYRNQGRWEEAETLEAQVIKKSTTKLGADHPNTLTSMSNLASTFYHQGRWEEAEKLNVQVIEKSKTKLGADHPDTLTSMNNLALTLWNQGRWEEAEKLEVQVVEKRKTTLGADHPDTLTSMSNLAFTWRDQGRHIEALALMRKCVLACERILGSEHPYTVSSVAALEEWS